MKCIDAEKLKAHIQYLIKKDNYELFDVPELLSFIGSLPTETSEDLEKEISRYLRTECAEDDEPSIPEIARHFANWQKEQMMKDVVEADVNTYRDLVTDKSWAEFVVEMPINKLGDKVHLIIIKV